MERTLPRPLAVPVQSAAMLASVVVALVLVTDALRATGGTPLWDTHAYWQAASRLQEGLPLYDPSLDPNGNAAFRYAPWFAAAWIPLTYLPPALVLSAWWVALAAAWVLCLVPLRTSPVAVVLFGALTFHGLWVGNVQSLMMLPLVYRLDNRDGPWWIALAASLKAVPILFVLVYLGRGEWRRAAVTFALTALLVAPMLLFDLSGYPVGSAAEGSLMGVSPFLWAAVAGVAVLVALRTAWPLAAGVAALLALPRLILYDASFLLLGVGPQRDREAFRLDRRAVHAPALDRHGDVRAVIREG